MPAMSCISHHDAKRRETYPVPETFGSRENSDLFEEQTGSTCTWQSDMIFEGKMYVTQSYIDVDEAAENPDLVNGSVTIGITLIDNKTLIRPMVTDFGPRSGNSLVLFAKDMDTIIRGLSAYTGSSSIALTGPVAALPMVFGDPRKRQNVTAQYIKGQVQNVGNNVKGLRVKAMGTFERWQNKRGGTPNAKLKEMQRFGNRIGFDGHLWHDGPKNYGGTKDTVRDYNLAVSHALVYLFPASYRMSFNRNVVCAIDGKGETSLAAIARLLRTVKL
ncbi:hypothetical protein J2Y63_001827 [Shinella sp. BE166]|uniref:hypothetical protein n=2 Tax=unclassified Shinella TaxID=2643062 RepID=UPI003EBEBE89